MENKGKVKFIRKNGRVIPVKDNGKGPSNNKKPKKMKTSNAEKASFNMGRSALHSSKMRDANKKNSSRTGLFAMAGAIGGAFGAGKLKKKLLGGIIGGALGSMYGSNTGKHGKQAREHGKKAMGYHEKFLKNYKKVKNKDELGDGSSRRAYRRGFDGSSV